MKVMNTIKWISAAAASLALACLGTGAVAQDDFNKDIKPGLNIHADSDQGSVLSRAAREGVSVVISEEGARSTVPIESMIEIYTVKEGDTLWDICVKFFSDPYVWPRIWSYNTRITNPHWIYPGDSIWLVPPGPMTQTPAAVDAPAVIKPRPKAILVRNRGFVDKKTLEESGKIAGSQKEVMMLAQYDEAYAEFEGTKEIRQGDEFAVFKIIEDVEGVDDSEEEGDDLGKLVEILGVTRVTQYDKETGVARVVIDESLKPIERGDLIGPVHRRFEFVSPVINERELKGHVVAFLDPTVLAATHQIVFVDKGRKHGVKEGNRFFVIEKRDSYRESMEEPDDNEGYPFEVLAEMRVVEAREGTSTCLVTASVKELEVGEQVEMIKGY